MGANKEVMNIKKAAICKGDQAWRPRLRHWSQCGFYSLLSGVLVSEKGHVYSCEPLQDNVRNPRKHMEMNRVTNCNVMEVAASSVDREALFDPPSDRYTAHLSTNGNIRVRSAELDTLVLREEIRPPDFMKIDIEGAEYDCLPRLRAHDPDISSHCICRDSRSGYSRCVPEGAVIDWEYEVGSLDARPVESTDELIGRPRNQ